jgi:UDP-N-acetylmuramoyl-tripeptide--D-alanyl-D-alanine ligase
MEPFARLIGPDVTVVTGIGTEHSRTLGGGADIAREKCKMVSVLPSNGLAVLNGDDPHVLWMAERTRARVITYGFDPSNDVSACNVKLDWPRGTTFTVSVEGTEYQARTRLIGRHMVPPVLAAVAVASAEGLAVAEVLANVAEVEPTRGRMHPVKLPNGAIMLRDDFKTPLESVYAALETLEEIPAERKIVVQADISEPPGKRRKVHREVGARIAEVADLAVFIGEGRKAYASGAARAGMPRESIFNAGYGVERALEYLRETLQPGDVVLVKGRLALRLERITLALQGLTVTCGIQNCPALSRPCELCPQLARDWGAPAGAGVERQTGSR